MIENKLFRIEYEIFPLRAIYYLDVMGTSEEDALRGFWDIKPDGIVRSVNGQVKQERLRNPN